MEQAPKVNFSEEVFELSAQLIESGIMRELQDDYLYWDKVKYKTTIPNKELLWSAVKLQRTVSRKFVTFGKYRFSYPITDFIQAFYRQFDMNAGGTLTNNIGIAETDKEKFIISSLIEESINSSQMEGASTTRKKAKEMIQKAQKPRTHSEQMILNNYITMKHIVDIKNEELTLEKLLHIHQLIVYQTLHDGADEGVLRTNDEIFVENTMAGEIVHYPPPQEELNILLHELIHFFNHDDDKQFIHPIAKACIIHFMIGWIHPFVDGNGRTARALFYWYMLKNGYWLTEYLSISKIIKETKNQYEKAYLYSEADEYDLGYFITYKLKTLQKAYKALKAYINKKQNEVFQAAHFMKIKGVNERMAQIIKLLHDDPERILSSKEVENRFSISNFTARQDLKGLLNLGLVEEVHVNKKKINYIKSNQFDKIIKNK